MKFNPVLRIRLITIAVLAVALLFLARLFFIQVVRGDDYKEMGDRQYLRPSGNTFNRGTIFFTTKKGDLVSAATLKHGSIIAMNPRLVADKEGAYNKIAPILGLENKEEFIEKASKADDPYEEIATRVDLPKADQVRKLSLKGVQVYKEKWRYYPGGETASHAVGFMGYKGDSLEGRYGLEKYYNDVLSREGNETFTNFFAEIFSGLGKGLVDGDKGEGDIVTSIEPQVQLYLEQVLGRAKEKYTAPRTGGIIMDPKTGEIVAMAYLPNFNPGEKQEDVALLSNPLVDSVYEMGSIVKPLTMAIGLDTGAVTARTTYNDKGKITLNNMTIGNYDGKARGVVPMQEVLNQSLNTGVVSVQQKVGKENFRKYMLNFGLGEKTGIDLPGEVSGLVKNLDSKIDVDLATISFGQGISMTPIETVRALGALGNGGYLVEPHVVKKIKYKTRLEEKVEPEIIRQVIKKETSEEITRMLVEVVDKALAQGKIKLEHFSVAAKTGTAQLVEAGSKKYAEGKYLHSFFGYFPAYEPRFIIFLYIVEPHGVQYASETLTEPFAELTKYLLNYYEIPPDR